MVLLTEEAALAVASDPYYEGEEIKMPKVYEAVLRLAQFGEWDWTEADEVEGLVNLEEFEEHLCAEGHDWQRTNALKGLIHNERGRVYRLTHAPDPDGSHNDTYHMVWVEEA